MSRRIGIVISVLVILAFLGASRVIAQDGGQVAPQDMLGMGFTYQGQLKDSGGTAITDTCNFQFTLWDSLTGGNQFGDPSIVLGVSVVKGAFSVVVNDGAEFGDTAFNGQARWLEISVQCTRDTGYTTLAPRQALMPAPYALTLRPGAAIRGLSGSNSAALRVENTNASDTTFGVRGQSDSTAGSGVFGYANAVTGATNGVLGQVSDSSAGSGVYGKASSPSGNTNGVYGESDSISGYGVYGYAQATSGDTAGVGGESDSPVGTGVYGWAGSQSDNYTAYGMWGQSDSTAGIGMFGYTTAGSGSTYGVEGKSDSTSGSGVYGYADANSGNTDGVEGFSSSTSGNGVFGLASASSGSTYGVQGLSDSYAGTGVFGSGGAYGVWGVSTASPSAGVFGHSTGTSGKNYGVEGVVDSPAGAGVAGNATDTFGYADGVSGSSSGTSGTGVAGYALSSSGSNTGVYGMTNSTSGFGVFGEAIPTSGTAVGVYGAAYSAQGYGVFSNGNLGYTGALSHVTATADYGWRSLYATESAQVWNEDENSAQLVQGEAVVAIDPVFAQTVNLNEDYLVFLTPRGDCALYVAEQTPTSFTVRAQGGGTCSIAFNYRLDAAPLGKEPARLAVAQDPTLMQAAASAAQAAHSQKP